MVDNDANTNQISKWLLSPSSNMTCSGEELSNLAKRAYTGHGSMTQDKYHEFEWNTKSNRNLVYGMYNRQFASR